MENSAYASNPLPPPALVVFSQAGGLPETLRMQRPFNSQAQEGKELQVPFSTGPGFGLRLLDSYSTLPAHLLHHLQPQFHIHPALDPRSGPFGSAAAAAAAASYQALADSNKSFPSAFAPPPSKCLKMESENQNNNNTPVFYQRAGSTSPGSVSASPSPKPDDSLAGTTTDERDATHTPSSEGNDSSTQEEGRGFRRKKRFQPEPWCCPVCSCTLRPNELDAHLLHELDKLYKLAPSRPNAPTPRPRSAQGSPTDPAVDARWQTYQRIKANRQGRLRIKYRKRKPDEVTCPVCNEPVSGSVEQLNNHVELCLRKQGQGDEDESENVDVEGEGDLEMYEEYEWAGQRRIRASTLLVGGFSGAGIGTNNRPTREEEEAYLVVDGDDTATFGPSQYSEADVISPSADDGDNDMSPECRSEDLRLQPVKEEPSETADEAGSQSQVLEALKSRIRDLEYESKGISEEKFICLICMEHYKKPVISICCWHVHCEQCWLHTLVSIQNYTSVHYYLLNIVILSAVR
ncbi:E3 ubiquitin-protein ligase Rnf220 [Nilaparvata lugens]|uniref:E3 ubiquitin-protein ligase Rnf220 n=1 Tax=Nilaparvata lugens TaxID=108931 RepID=UPI00193E3DCC|nr:E3 ubiquitin-protein ligase Rnf220 [Nilaparvata lugens]XP_039298743.1 E3 ubiquitin-protein ligase Rnf220 [Nilaparvata lugens]